MKYLLLTFICLLNAVALEKPNIVIFLVDDMGVMDTSVPFLTDKSGQPVVHDLNKFYKTPAMASLAARGMSFTHFYANSVCSPTRASLMTGQYSARHRITQFIGPEKRNSGPAGWLWEGLNKDHVTLPRLLSSAGYKTIHCGKAHFAPSKHPGADPKVVGFDVNIAGCAYGQPGSYYGKENFGHGKKGREKRAVPGLEQYHGKDIFLTEALALEVNKAITKSVEEKKPFFAYMSHYAVHSPFQSDKRFADNYTSNNSKAQAYATLIEGMDKSLSDIVAHLKKLGIAKNTLILFIGDNGSDAPLGATHGYSSSAPLRGKKGTHYEGGMRVPFIAAWGEEADNELQKKCPVKQGLIHDEFATICDVFPTVLELAGVVSPSSHIVDGESIIKYFSGTKGFHKQQFLMHFPHGHRSDNFTVYRERNFKLIYHYKAKGDKRYELFDLTEDPYEKNNLATAKPEVLKTMLKTMKSELEKADALYINDKVKGLLKPE